jgi:hypothetical protein
MVLIAWVEIVYWTQWFSEILGRKAAKFAKKEGNEISKESSLALLADVNNPTEFKAFIVNEPLKFRS